MNLAHLRISLVTPIIDGPNEEEHVLQRLVDRSEITDLIHRLGRSLDHKQFDNLRTILTPTATASTPGGQAEGIDAVVAQASRNHGDHEQIQHVITDVLVDVDGDNATATANLVVTFADADVPKLVLGERYRFGAARRPEGWRLASVTTDLVWRTTS
jgi:ketosteroid isomerase-like protein